MPEMPTLGDAPKKSPLPAVVITALLVGGAAGGMYWWKNKTSVEQATPAAAAPTAPPADPMAAAPTAPAAPLPAGMPGQTGTPTTLPPPSLPPDPGTVAAKPAADATGLKSFHTAIKGPLEGAVVSAVGKDVGQPLTQVINRTLVWWMKIPGDLLKGDELSVVYEERANQEPVVHAVRFVSKKFDKTFEAYRFKSKDENYPRFYEPSGEELEQRLVDGPLDGWEQVTSLLKDGRKHKGVDFKTAQGTPVKATFDGTITRTTWFFRGNGNSIEIAESGGQGRTAMFLHLSEINKEIVPGSKVKKGAVIAKSGNTGHSFAPHLHYQLMKGDKVIDPFESHKTFKKSLEPTEKPKLDAEVARFKGLIGSAGGQVAGAFGRK
jgi:murein DD-endopeptidase MepM/ murein hydrolase activator NlpD